MRKRAALLVVSLWVVGCGDSKSTPVTEETAPATTSTVLNMKQLRARGIGKMMGSASSASPMKVDKPKAGEVPAANYPEAGIPAIDASCKAPWVVVRLSDVTAGLRDAAVVEQALVANPAFKVVDGAPHAAGEIAVEFRGTLPMATNALPPATSGAPKSSAAPSVSGAPKASAAPSASLPPGSGNFIVATCHDAGTCTRFAAMLKAVAKWNATTGCGELDAKVSATPKARSLGATPANAGDLAALCARVGACKMASEPASTDDPIGACERASSSFKTDCALKTSCADVLKCLQ